MKLFKRRDFLRLAGAVGAGTALAGWPAARVLAKKGAHIVVVGGGFGGATCANYLKRYDPSLRVTLVEPNKTFHTCPFSNTVIGGINDMKYIAHNYDGLRKTRGVEVVHDRVTAIDAGKKKVSLQGGRSLSYDKLVVSPGIDFRWEAIGGYDEAASRKVPHAWQAGSQTTLLRDQLRAMKDGGVVILTAPGNPFRCPPGPYERASMIAWYLKQNKPKSRILILDAKDKFSKQGLFMQGWAQHYPGMIEWVKGSDGGDVESIDIKTMEITARFGGKHKGDVINVIPPQKAGAIAHTAGLVNADGWCPVNKSTFESTLHKDVYVIGDASVASPLPKSGFAASSEGKMAAAAIVTALHGETLPIATYTNTCYSLITPDHGISVAAVYRFEDGEIKTTSSGVSPMDVDARFRHAEARHAVGWYKAITEDAFAV